MSKKRVLSLMLTIALTIGCVMPAFATEISDDIVETDVEEIVLADDAGEAVVVEESDEIELEAEEAVDVIDAIDDEDASEDGLNSAPFMYATELNGYSILIEAASGVLPNNVTATVEKVTKVGGEMPEVLIREQLDENDAINGIVAFKVVYKADGKVVEPKGKVNVSVTCPNEAVKAQLSGTAINKIKDSKPVVSVFTLSGNNANKVSSAEGTDKATFVSNDDVYVVVVTERFEYVGGHDDTPVGKVVMFDEAGNATVSDKSMSISEAEYEDFVDASTLPSKYDGRKYLPNLRNQNPYGTCWAHAAMATAEAYIKRRDTSKNPNYSEAHLAYFNYNSVVDPLGLTKGDSMKYNSSNRDDPKWDVGGNAWRYTQTAAKWVGPAKESLVPYKTFGKKVASDLAYEDVLHMKNSYILNIKKDRNSVKNYIMKNGAVDISYFHKDSYYNKTNNCYYDPKSSGTNHAVTVVGWDDNFSRTKFGSYKPTKNGAWLVRNSWITAKKGDPYYNSMYGYFWMSYYDKGLAEAAFAFDYDKASKYKYNYQYDGSPLDDAIGFTGKNSYTTANVFTTKACSKEKLKAVGFYITNTKASYTVKVYKNPSKSNPESGKLVATKKGSSKYPGMRTVVLPKEVTLSKGDKFSVVVTITIPSDSKENGARMAVECAYKGTNWTTKVAAKKAGRSYYKNPYTNKWVDTYNDSNFDKSWGNFRIKGYTVKK